MPFEKGRQKTGGRKPGSLNKATMNYLDLQVWGKMILDGVSEATPKERIEVGFRALALLLTKIANLPSTPADSLANALQAQQALEQLEEVKVDPVP